MNASLRRLEEEFGPFAEVRRDDKLEAIGHAVKDQPELFGASVWDAFSESELSEELATKLFNPHVSDADIGALVRKLQIEYAMSVSAYQGKDLRRYL